MPATRGSVDFQQVGTRDGGRSVFGWSNPVFFFVCFYNLYSFFLFLLLHNGLRLLFFLRIFFGGFSLLFGMDLEEAKPTPKQTH